MTRSPDGTYLYCLKNLCHKPPGEAEPWNSCDTIDHTEDIISDAHAEIWWWKELRVAFCGGSLVGVIDVFRVARKQLLMTMQS